MANFGDLNSSAGLSALAEALEGGKYVNGTRFPSRDDLVVYAAIHRSTLSEGSTLAGRWKRKKKIEQKIGRLPFE